MNDAALPAAALTITVQITVPDDVLSLTARRLIDDLRTLTETAVELSPQGSMVGPRSDDRPERVSPVPSREPQLRLVSPMPPQPRGTAAVPGGKPTLYLETSSRTAWRDGVPVHLSRREYDLLSYLCRHPRRVFGRAQLLRSVWEYEMVGGERTVDVHVRRLRAKLGECADGIVTVRGVGYRFDDQAVVAIVADPE